MDNTQMVRSFVGIDVPMSSGISHLQKYLEHQLGEVMPGSFIREPRLHITLAFLGDIESSLLVEESELDNILRQTAQQQNYSVRFRIASNIMQLGTNVIALEIDDSVHDLAKIASFLQQTLPTVINKPHLTFQPFLPHITQGRTSAEFRKQYRDLLLDTILPADSLRHSAQETVSSVASLVLYGSLGRKTLAEYEIGTRRRLSSSESH